MTRHRLTPTSRPDSEAAGRAPWGSISREDIVAAATGIVTAGGHEEMSIRSLAASLGVAPMSLYRHIRDKDDLLGEVTDRLLAGSWRPAAAEEDWQAWITEAASRLRDFLVSQPAALHVYLSHPVVSPAAIDRMNAMMSVLHRAGLSEEAARSAYGALHTYTIGFAALEASRAWLRPRPRGHPRRGCRPPRPAACRLHHHRAVHPGPALPAPGNQQPRRGPSGKAALDQERHPAGRDERLAGGAPPSAGKDNSSGQRDAGERTSAD